MKFPIALPAILLFVASSAPFTTYAATDTDKVQAPAAQPESPAPKKMTPHSHLQEKLGIRPKAPVVAAENKYGMDKSKHFHPRDGK